MEENINPKTLARAQKNLGELLDTRNVSFEYAPRTSDAVARGFDIPGFKGKETRLEGILSEALGGPVKGEYTQKDALTGINFLRSQQAAIEAAAALTPEKIAFVKTHLERLQEASPTQTR